MTDLLDQLAGEVIYSRQHYLEEAHVVQPGEKLADIDPRIQLGQILAAAEATDGIIKLNIKGEAEPVTVKIPVLGAYSKTWPLNCPKSDRIVRGVADYLAKPESTEGLGGIGMLFLLSTGEDAYLPTVKRFVDALATELNLVEIIDVLARILYLKVHCDA